MPCRLRVKINSAKGLPVMDKASESTDAYVEVKFAQLTPFKTKICPKTLNPEWRQSFQFEVSRDKHLQDAPVEIKVFDHDVVHDDIIGSVNIDITCLLMNKGPSKISGWFPLYDSIRGIRGHINAVVKLEFVDNSSKFKDTSARVKFFSISGPILQYKIHALLGFVEELIVEDDPEYHWNSFRYSRSTNEQRQNLLYHISGKLRRKIGITVQEIGGNAVLGYRQHFDFEGEGGGGIVARAYGTACLLHKDIAAAPTSNPPQITPETTPASEWAANIAPSVPLSSPMLGYSEILASPVVPASDVQLYSIDKIPNFVTINIGGLVMTRSVKLMKNSHRRRNRDKWWTTVREEIRAHARALYCNSVFGYTETTTIEEEVVVLSASGTACRIVSDNSQPKESAPKEEKKKSSSEQRKKKKKTTSEPRKKKKKKTPCCASHISYSPATSIFAMRMTTCKFCKKYKVPEILLATVHPPADLLYEAPTCLIQARVCRKYKKTENRDATAIAVSESIPFLEFDLHRQLLYKMRVLGVNSCFDLRVQINLSQNCITAVATGTGLLVSNMNPPPVLNLFDMFNADPPPWLDNLRISSGEGDNPRHDDQPHEEEDFHEPVEHSSQEHGEESTSNSEMDANRYFLDVSDRQENMAPLMDPPLPTGLNFCTTEKYPCGPPPIANLQLLVLFTRVSWTIDDERVNQEFASIFQLSFRKIIFQLLSLIPCTVTGIRVDVQLPSENEVDILITGMALDCSEFPVIPLEEKQAITDDTNSVHSSLTQIDTSESDTDCRKSQLLNFDSKLSIQMEKSLIPSVDLGNTRSTSGPNIFSPRGESLEDTSVIVTTLDFVPGYKFKRYVGRVNHHLIRENRENNPKDQKMGVLTNVFLRESLSIARAHVLAMGGNALIGFKIDYFSLVEKTQSRQGYCLISFSGDAVVARKKKLPAPPLISP